MPAPMTVMQRLRRKAPRTMKFVRRWLHAGPRAGGARPIFVVGSQRSGTRVPLQMFDRAPDVMTYSEGSAPFFDGVLLRPLPVVERLLRRHPFPVVVLKPICETHRVIELLDRFPGSRAIWIFRHYRDAVNSAAAKWRSGPEGVRRLAAGELDRAGWRAGGLTPAKLELVRRCYREDLSQHAAQALMWYLRNDLFFDLAASRRPDILLVQYEDLVTRPAVAVDRFAAFTDIRMPAVCADDVYESSLSKRPFPAIPDAIDALCRDVERRLVAAYRDQAAPDALAVVR